MLVRGVIKCKFADMVTDRIKVVRKYEANLSGDEDVLKMLDKMRNIETEDGVSRASMVRIAIREAFKKRKLKLK